MACVEVKGQPSTLFTIEYAVLAGLQAPEILLPPVCCRTLQYALEMLAIMPGFSWVLGIHHQALTLKLQARYAELSHQLLSMFLNFMLSSLPILPHLRLLMN